MNQNNKVNKLKYKKNNDKLHVTFFFDIHDIHDDIHKIVDISTENTYHWRYYIWRALFRPVSERSQEPT